MAAYPQALKEIFADPSEALRLRWIDVDFLNNTITINQPVKRHKPRQLKVSSRLIAMLNALPRTLERLFPTTYKTMYECLKIYDLELLKHYRIQDCEIYPSQHFDIRTQL